MSSFVVRATQLAFAFRDHVPLFEALDLQLEPGWTGVVGPNGAGKTTLLRLVSGALAPTAGSIRVSHARSARGAADALVVTCAQSVETLADDVCMLADTDEPSGYRLRAALALAPDALDRWATLSPGERKRWQVGAALQRRPDVLLLDEPSNHLDGAARALLIDALRRFRGVGLVVSHDRALLEALTTRTLWLERGRGQLYDGSYEAARAQRAESRRSELDEWQRARVERERLAQSLDAARRQREAAQRMRNTGRRMRNIHDSDARGAHANYRAGRAEKSAGKLVGARRQRLERAVDEAPRQLEKQLGASVFAGYERAAAPRVLSLTSSELRAGERLVLRDVSLTLARDARVHLRGPNGAGKTTLARALLNAAHLAPERVLWLPQETSAAEDSALLREVRALPAEQRGRVLSVVAALGCDPDVLLATVQPSPGESRKLRLAVGLGRHAQVLVLDEPSNHLDLDSVERIEAALLDYPGALLLVTHDDALAARLTDEKWTLADGRVRVSSR